MCRFLLVSAKKTMPVTELSNQFATMCRQSRTADGDWQGDGWGAAWLDDSRQWQEYKSLKPIWEDLANLNKLPSTNHLMLHARSASFAGQIGVLEYNQPYLNHGYGFAFNGLISGVKMPTPVAGKIGAQKIFNLILSALNDDPPQHALASVHRLIKKHSKSVNGFNLGLSDKSNFYVLSDYAGNQEYFQLKSYNDNYLHLVCSEPIGAYAWKNMTKNKVYALG
jgi:predicted glutamine amidotransferase